MSAESFSRPEPNVIASTAGFSIEVLGRTGMRYAEGDRSVEIDSEVLAGENGIGVWPESIRAWEGPEPLLVSEEERERIISNIRRALAAYGHPLEVSGP